MAHAEQAEFIEIVKRHLPTYFANSRVLEIGALDINGSVRGLFRPSSYIGVDLDAGAGVDLVRPGQLIDLPSESFDCAISLECFEHNPFWLESFVNMLRMTRPGGLVLVTCATTGRREHGTARSSPEASPLTAGRGQQYYRNLTENDFTRRLDFRNWFSDWRFFIAHESYDLYFAGLRGGASRTMFDPGFELEVRRRFNPAHSWRAFRRYVKVKAFRNFLSSPVSYYFTRRR
jgi:SAM-dependent methyltransferase